MAKDKKKKKYKNPTSIDNDHAHDFQIDDVGNGRTTSTLPASHEPHIHQIVNFKVLEVNNHIHTIEPIDTKLADQIDGWLLAEERIPRDEIMLFPYGFFNHKLYGTLDFREDFFKQVIDNFDNDVLGIKPFMDEDHNGGSALAEFNTPPYFKQGQGLFIKPEWTPYGREMLAEGKYRYFSPWYEDFQDARTKKVFKNVFRGGGATNRPFLKSMPPIVDKIEAPEELDVDAKKDINIKIQLNDLMYIEPDTATVETRSDDTGVEIEGKDISLKQEENMDELKKLYGLSPEATDAEVLAKAQEFVNKTNEVEEIKEEISEIKASDNTNEIDTLKAELNEVKVSKFLSENLGKKFTVKDKDFWKEKFLNDSKGTEEIVSKLNDVVDFGEKGSKGDSMKEKFDTETYMQEARKLAEEKKITVSEAIIKLNEDHPEYGKEWEKTYLSDYSGLRPKRF